MAIRRYLAMTAAEFQGGEDVPGYIPAWMACHFSPYGSGLTNLPGHLPQGGLLILNDWFALEGHDSSRVAEQLSQVVESFACPSVLLDFQRLETPGLRELAAYLSQALPCPAVVPANLADGLDCPVFLPPCPHHIPLKKYIAPWLGRELWLDMALDAETVTVTEEGSIFSPGEIPEKTACIHRDKILCCHYCQEVTSDQVQFQLWRTGEDLEDLSRCAQELGIHALVGLYLELCPQNAKAVLL